MVTAGFSLMHKYDPIFIVNEIWSVTFFANKVLVIFFFIHAVKSKLSLYTTIK